VSAENIINFLGQFCKDSTGDLQRWHGNKSTYHWNRGRESATGEINGVVRKLAGVTGSGQEIWVVAGSFKIAADGTILRFTGLTRKNWNFLEGQLAVISSVAELETA